VTPLFIVPVAFLTVKWVEVLLQHSKMDVNAGNAGKATPFSLACQEGHLEVVSLLLGDLRIDVNKLERPQGSGVTTPG